MKHQSFLDLPDESNLWIYGFESNLTSREQEILNNRLSTFLSQWETHGRPVLGAFEIVEQRFVVLAGFSPGGISGCSVDSSVRVFKELREQSLDGLDRSRIYFRTRDGSIEGVHFTAFQERVEKGEIGSDTPVFDINLTSLGQLRTKGFEKQFEKSWHARAFLTPRTA